MSLGVAIKGPEGVVLAADSRVTLVATRLDQPPIQVNYDNATKLLGFSEKHNYVGAVTYGAAVIGSRTAYSFLPEIEVELEKKERMPVYEFAVFLSEFYMAQWTELMPKNFPGPPMTFILGGYDPEAPYGKVFRMAIPSSPMPEEQNPGDKNFGMSWGGQLEIASRIIHGFDPKLPGLLQNKLNVDEEKVAELLDDLRTNLEFSIPYQVLPLQECVDLATFMVRTTREAQNFAIGVRGVGGPIDVAVITRTNGLEYVQKKELHINKK